MYCQSFYLEISHYLAAFFNIVEDMEADNFSIISIYLCYLFSF